MKNGVTFLLATNHPYLPQMYGGAQASLRDTAQMLAQDARHKVVVSSGLTKAGVLGFTARAKMKLGFAAAKDAGLGYPVYRAWDPLAAAKQAITSRAPDCAIVQSMSGVAIAQACTRNRIPTIYYFHNVEPDSTNDEIKSLNVEFIANSLYSSRKVKHILGLDVNVIPPFYFNESYSTSRENADSVLFVNPIPEKGLDTAIELARLCPDIPFIFAEAWWTSAEKKSLLKQRISDLRNVTLVPPRNDMTSLYKRTRVLLLPSTWNEAWGRVASEAHMSSIPVIASNLGGLPEAVGPGGVLVDRDAPIADWVAKLRRAWDDQTYFDALCDKAHTYARREQLSVGWQIEAFQQAAKEARRRLNV